MKTLQVFKIFKSIQGESSWQGRNCTFIRLSGCSLNCSWCDTPEAKSFDSGTSMDIDQIVKVVSVTGCTLVEVTGGEPLDQKNTLALLCQLNDKGFETLLETSGAFSISGVDKRTKIIMDIKPPSSGENEKMLSSNLNILKTGDEVKFPIADRNDFSRALGQLRELEDRCFTPLFTPVEPFMNPKVLAKWFLEEAPPDARFQLQLHKLLNLA
ncbi:MAG: radical SAM protein [Deltaproteobacteria bacterium]|jgi:7-carboxy-7-deazaguanine synthase|nr:radical SAM protein [Deltaproteobacteria bacterium]